MSRYNYMTRLVEKVKKAAGNIRKKAPRSARAMLDSTATNPTTVDYYLDAVGENAAQTFDRYTRETAQARGQFEFLNDPLFYGAAVKIAALVCGSGVALKIDGILSRQNEQPVDGAGLQYLEDIFAQYSNDINLLDDMRLIVQELLYHGEAFVVKRKSQTTVEGFKYLFIRPERVSDPFGTSTEPRQLDGILYDNDGDDAEPIGYFIQREPLNPVLITAPVWDFVPAGEVVHIFNRILPQQRRGVPEIQTALGLIREIKLLKEQEIAAVKNAAKASVILRTSDQELVDAYLDSQETRQAYAPGRRGDLPQGLYVAPPGYEPIFGDSKHPATGFDAFKKVLAADVGGVLGIGSGKANNDHSAYNFSSAKMDEQIDATLVSVRQKTLASSFLDVVFNDWITELSVRDSTARALLDAAGAPEFIVRRWLFPQPRSIDRLKDAQADEIELRNNTITVEEIAARRGKDAETLWTTRASELKKQAEILQQSGLGVSTSGNITTDRLDNPEDFSTINSEVEI